ncbi:MAG TPA: cation diffusion facilitator family transporter [Candidatus Methylomirabilis sp.]|nr:cation diffusion facilitator family transporter [Candidatus Methylomirabilis sp.]HSB81472.1 cation diffusion facilitator family transporter [Candidatus Methylomirabilis sp.]
MNAGKGQELRALTLAVGLYVLIFGLKLGVYLVTGVVVLLAEALHTLSDILISSFLLAAAIWSRKEADEIHMFGYGRAQNVAALVAATLFISLTSFKVFEEAIPRLFRPGASSYQHLPLALGVILLSMVLAALPLIGLFRETNRGAAAKAQLMELVNDELGLLAALIGTLFIAWGRPIADPIASMVVATIIAVNAIGLLRENLSVLLGRSPGPEVLGKVERLARSVEGVLGVHELRAEFIGPETVRAGMHIEVSRGLPIEEADRVAEEVRQRVHQATGCRYCVIHVDPAGPKKSPPAVEASPGPGTVRPPAEGGDASSPPS